MLHGPITKAMVTSILVESTSIILNDHKKGF